VLQPQAHDESPMAKFFRAEHDAGTSGPSMLITNTLRAESIPGSSRWRPPGEFPAASRFGPLHSFADHAAKMLPSTVPSREGLSTITRCGIPRTSLDPHDDKDRSWPTRGVVLAVPVMQSRVHSLRVRHDHAWVSPAEERDGPLDRVRRSPSSFSMCVSARIAAARASASSVGSSSLSCTKTSTPVCRLARM
jgi:hypothetical protein